MAYRETGPVLVAVQESSLFSTPRIDDLYDLYDLFPLDDLGLSRKIYS